MDGRLLVGLAVAASVVGCGKSSPVATPASQSGSAPAKSDPAIGAAATLAAAELVAALQAGNASADSLTIEFKKVIGEPLSPAEREKGFSDASAKEWLNLVGPRLRSAKVVSLGTSVGLFELDAGSLRLANVDSQWRVDWFHAGRPTGAAPILADSATKRFAVAAFLDPLFTNNWELSEATLSNDARKSLAPALGSDALGYNRGTLRGKLKGILNGATGYAVSLSGETVTVTLTGAVEKKLTLKLTPGPRPDVWLVSGID